MVGSKPPTSSCMKLRSGQIVFAVMTSYMQAQLSSYPIHAAEFMHIKYTLQKAFCYFNI